MWMGAVLGILVKQGLVELSGIMLEPDSLAFLV